MAGFVIVGVVIMAGFVIVGVVIMAGFVIVGVVGINGKAVVVATLEKTDCVKAVSRTLLRRLLSLLLILASFGSNNDCSCCCVRNFRNGLLLLVNAIGCDTNLAKDKVLEYANGSGKAVATNATIATAVIAKLVTDFLFSLFIPLASLLLLFPLL